MSQHIPAPAVADGQLGPGTGTEQPGGTDDVLSQPCTTPRPWRGKPGNPERITCSCYICADGHRGAGARGNREARVQEVLMAQQSLKGGIDVVTGADSGTSHACHCLLALGRDGSAPAPAGVA